MHAGLERFYQHVVPVGVVWTAVIIPQNDLEAWVVGITPITEELGHVLDVFVASGQFVLTACVVDPDEQRLLADTHDWQRNGRRCR
jgi:hypothetical protein